MTTLPDSHSGTVNTSFWADGSMLRVSATTNISRRFDRIDLALKRSNQSAEIIYNQFAEIIHNQNVEITNNYRVENLKLREEIDHRDRTIQSLREERDEIIEKLDELENGLREMQMTYICAESYDEPTTALGKRKRVSVCSSTDST